MIAWMLLMACSATSTEPAPATPPGAEPASLSAPGLQLTTRSWTGRDGQTGPAWVVHLTNPTLTVLPSDTLQPLPAFSAPSTDTYVHINGGFYDPQAQAMSLVVHDGTVHNSLGSGSGIVTGPRPVAILHKDAWQPGPGEALQSIDRIVNDGTSLVSHRPDARRAARSIIAVADDGVFVAVLAHERSASAEGSTVHLSATSFLGPTLAEAADFAVNELGATAALNLDGAVSSALIVSTPAGRVEVVGEQPIINAIRVQPGPAAN